MEKENHIKKIALSNMDRKNYLGFVASFLIMLVVTLPFYVADAHAAIESVSVKGNDGIEGYARPNDFLNFKVKASIEGDKIEAAQVVLGADNKFQKCAADVSGSYDCTLRFPASGTEDFEPRSLPFSISLFNDDGTLDESASGEFTIDNTAPEVSLSASKNKYSSSENITISYSITDFACNDPSCSGKCAGIKSIEFSSSGNSFSKKVDINSGCSSSGTISAESAKFDSGLNSIFAKATDNFKQVSAEAGATFEIDKEGPSIIADSFEITRKGFSISSFSPQKIPVTVSVNVTGDDLASGSVTADLSALNPSPSLKNAIAACTASAGVHSCRWSIELAPGQEGAKSIAVQASDTTGNKATATITKDLSLDNSGPKVLLLTTDKAAADKVFAKPTSNTVTAEFEEMTGLAKEDIFLYASGAKINPSRCVKDLNWVCVWENVNFNKDNPAMSIGEDTLDILENSVEEETSVELAIDQNVPVLNSLNITNVGSVSQAIPGLFKTGDKIAVAANLTEENGLSAAADFSKFVRNASNAEGTCERVEGNEHACVWISDTINIAGNGMIKLNFTDNAGNTLTVTRTLKVLGLVNATAPDFWKNEVMCSPKTIDRQLGPFISQREFCQVKLTPKSQVKDLSTVFIGPASCSGDTSIIEKVETSNTEAGSTSPLIKITLKRDEFKINSANLTCSFEIFSKTGNKITQNPEIEDAHITILFSNLPLGELSENVERDIKEAKENAKGIWEIIGVLNKFVFYAKKICQLINTYYNIVAVLYPIAVYFGLADAATDKTPAILFSSVSIKPAAIGACTGETTARVTAQGSYQVLNKFCAFVNCKQTILWGPTVANWINNQPLLSPSSLLGTETHVEGSTWYNREVKLNNDQPAGPLSDYIKPASEYINPNQNIFTAFIFACIPGVIYGLDKYRQIECLYADCLQNAVGKEGLPVSVCGDQKAFATCKYITTELFAVFPWTAMFDHFMGLIKNAMSNPFIGLGVGISLGCTYVCSIPEGITRTTLFTACEFVRYTNQLSTIIQDIKLMVDEGFKIRTDYCERLEDDEDEKQS